MRKFAVIAGVLVLAVLLGAAVEFGARGTSASSHREAPLISQDPAADNTDTYIFRSPDDPNTVTMIGNWYPYQGPAGGPNFYRFGDDVRYEFNIDNNGDAKPDIRYLFVFKTAILNSNTFLYNTGQVNSLQDGDLTLRQQYAVFKSTGGDPVKIGGGLIAPPANVGCHTYKTGLAFTIPAQPCGDGAAQYEALAQTAIYTLPGGEGKVFAGQRRDSFFADVGAIFDLLAIRGDFSSGGYNLFNQFSVQTIALQVPISSLTDGDDVIGFWASSSRKAKRVMPKESGKSAEVDSEGKINDKAWKQVSRLGLPLINEAVIPMALKDKFNATKPKDDVANFAGPVVNPELAVLLNAIYSVPVPPTPRQDLVDALLLGVPGLNRPSANNVPSDMIRLNTATPLCTSSCDTMGVIGGDNQGYPNGRRLTDDVIDISERVIAGVLVSGYDGSPNKDLGDGVNGAPYAFGSTFPYLATPLDGFSYVP